jgi:hypothetical protein
MADRLSDALIYACLPCSYLFVRRLAPYFVVWLQLEAFWYDGCLLVQMVAGTEKAWKDFGLSETACFFPQHGF